jgi:uncharacterized protein (TIGR01619 family)
MSSFPQDMPENWEFYLCARDDAPASVLVNLGLHEIAPLAELPWRFRVSLAIQEPTEYGLSQSAERPLLDEIEETITTRLFEQHGAVLVGRAITRGSFEIICYGPTDADPTATIRDALAPYHDYTCQCKVEHDPEWATYFDYLLPSPAEYQQVLNRQVLDALRGEGDTLEVPREVRHWIYFASEHDRSQFVEALAGSGFTAEPCEVEDDDADPDDADEAATAEDGLPFVLQIFRQDSVDLASINTLVDDLYALAEDYGGQYDGWETQVVVDEHLAN